MTESAAQERIYESGVRVPTGLPFISTTCGLGMASRSGFVPLFVS
jgi:hypothetical protein